METDVLVLGSGIAGLMLALECADRGADVLVLTKRRADDTSTNWAQGGIAAVFDPADSFARHERDTLKCGAGLSDPVVVRQVVEEAPERVRALEALGVRFSRTARGLALGREGGHSGRRIVHAKDFTGQTIEQALLVRVRAHRRIRLVEDQLALDLILESRLRGARSTGRAAGRSERCWGAYVMECGTGAAGSGRIRPVTAKVTVLATGGCGKVYLYTTNPDVATGDGIAMAYRAGAAVEDLEFVQFHPTCLYHPEAKSFMLTEALRGEGAVLRTLDGVRFMPRVHPMAELAPRDVVARAIDRELKRRGETHVTLDITHLSPARVKARFPNVYASLRRFGFDLTREPIPVVPAAHYMCGGVKATLSGRTSLRGLLALGEVARTGLHGANRLASTSLLEGLVWGNRAASDIEASLASAARPAPPALDDVPTWDESGLTTDSDPALIQGDMQTIQNVMWHYVGLVRSGERLSRAIRELRHLQNEIETLYRRTKLSDGLIGLRNAVEVGLIVADAARHNRTSRGCHYRTDAVQVGDRLL